jgi:hypothetical protein
VDAIIHITVDAIIHITVDAIIHITVDAIIHNGGEVSQWMQSSTTAAR